MTTTANEFNLSEQISFEQSLTQGQEIEVRWTNSFRYYRAVAVVIRVNDKSVRVRIVRAVKEGEAGAYLIGRELSFPKLLANKWSQNNGVFALVVEKTEPAAPPPAKVSTEHVNDLCERCGEPVHVPAYTVRCEWGCCILDASEEALRNNAARQNHRNVIHACRECRAETHRFDLVHLISRAERKVPYFTPKHLRTLETT